jgi:hypothetical protein
MRVEVSALVKDAPERVFAWWTDYGAVGHEETVDHGMGRSRRRVVGREGDVVTLEERVLGLKVATHTVELHPARLAFRERAEAFEAWWSFEPAPEGTRVRREVEVKGPGRFAPVAIVRAFNQRDVEHHAREYDRSHLK